MEETNITNQDQPADNFELKLQRSAAGQRIASRGKLVGAIIGKGIRRGSCRRLRQQHLSYRWRCPYASRR